MTDKLRDCLKPGLDLVFVGTAAGKRSAQEGAYYAHPGNKFWRTLAEVHLTDGECHRSRFQELMKLGIGFTDMCKAHAGMDRDIHPDNYDRNDFIRKISKYKPRVIGFTSKKAGSVWLQCKTKDVEYGHQRERIGSTEIFILPSPSGAASGHWCIKPWKELADLILSIRAKHPPLSQIAHSPE